jgi:eukaryotic-like serine/threonine-protein kinase
MTTFDPANRDSTKSPEPRTASQNLSDSDATLNSDGTLDESSEHPPSATAPIEPRTIGRYKLMLKIGDGGMGQVWLAEQTTPVRRQVALKLIKAGMYDSDLAARFLAERQSLALMDHPSIAKVFDAGTTPEGQPYFVMEYVAGVPITRYCDQKRLNVAQRLQLFIAVCEAAQHAHQKAIIHRDLKPANILVIEVDGKPMPRIIDFGLAKPVAMTSPGENPLTRFGGFVGTPGYMSPEQADPSIEDVDTRADVYSLGVVLYELLCGYLPFDMKRWNKQPMSEVLRQLREDEPTWPSRRLLSGGEPSSVSAQLRDVDTKQLVRQLRGDLDRITMKAMEKERSLRYATPSALADDIGRYLNHEPVLARPASASYRVRKYIRRNRFPVIAATTLFALLTGFGITQTVQLRKITRERDRANRLTDFMTGMFKVSDPGEARGNSIVVREVLDNASRDIDSGLSQDPELQARLMYTMATVYRNLGLYSRAQPLIEKALQIQERVLGSEHPDTLRSKSSLAWCLSQEGHYGMAEKLERDTLNSDHRVLKANDPDTLSSISNLAWILSQEGQYGEAERLGRSNLAAEVRIFGSDDERTIRSTNNLASTLFEEGKYGEAENLERDALARERRRFGADHPDTLATAANLASILQDEGHYDEAEDVERETLSTQQRVLGPEHPSTVRTMNNLSSTLSSERRYAEAEKFSRATLDIERKLSKSDAPEVLTFQENLGIILSYETRYDEANKLFLDAIEKAAQSPERSALSDAWYAYACGAAISGHQDLAFHYLHQAIDHGFSDADSVASDEDLRSLRNDPRFDAILKDLRSGKK